MPPPNAPLVKATRPARGAPTTWQTHPQSLPTRRITAARKRTTIHNVKDAPPAGTSPPPSPELFPFRALSPSCRPHLLRPATHPTRPASLHRAHRYRVRPSRSSTSTPASAYRTPCTPRRCGVGIKRIRYRRRYRTAHASAWLANRESGIVMRGRPQRLPAPHCRNSSLSSDNRLRRSRTGRRSSACAVCYTSSSSNPVILANGG
ncbi:hypothetical protein C8Q79DRAFT_581704 [Trametes meyenii]|nr:hypothetical protein C8Q79DRAFT_581704 [Trametes meyenii]